MGLLLVLRMLDKFAVVVFDVGQKEVLFRFKKELPV